MRNLFSEPIWKLDKREPENIYYICNYFLSILYKIQDDFYVSKMRMQTLKCR